LTNDVSPLIPATLLLIAITATCFVQLRRSTYFHDRRPEIPNMKDDDFCKELNKLEDKINGQISPFCVRRLESSKQIHWLYLILLVPLILAASYLCNRSFQTVESWPLEYLMMGLAITAAIGILLAWTRFVLIWSSFSESYSNGASSYSAGFQPFT
jgi:hypothetical protein